MNLRIPLFLYELLILQLFVVFPDMKLVFAIFPNRCPFQCQYTECDQFDMYTHINPLIPVIFMYRLFEHKLEIGHSSRSLTGLLQWSELVLAWHSYLYSCSYFSINIMVNIILQAGYVSDMII